MKKFILSLSVVSIFQTGFGQKQTLGFNLTIGETYYQTTRAETNITQEINNQKTSIDMTVSGKMAYKITGFNDSSYEMNANYQELSITMNLPNEAMTFSSEKDDENDLVSIMLSALKDKPFFMKMTTTGKIVEIKNLDSLFDGMFDKAPLLPPEQKQQMKAQLMQAYGERALKGSMEMVTAIYPDRPVKKGDTWKINTKLEAGMAGNLTTTFAYKERTNDYNLITGDGRIETLDKEAYIQVNEMPIKYNLSGSMVSTIKVDIKTGWVLESKIKHNIAGTAEIKDNPKIPGGMIIPMTLQMETTHSSK